MLETCIFHAFFSEVLGRQASIIACMDVLKVNRFGRSYHAGKALNDDIRVIDKIIARGGDRVTGYIPVTHV